MYIKVYTCRRCGRSYEVEYPDYRSASLGRRTHCDECKDIIQKEKARKQNIKRRRAKGIPDSDIRCQTVMSRACDRFFEKRGIKAEDPRQTLYLNTIIRKSVKEEDVIDAINYGEAAFERYKKLQKKQEGKHEQTQEGRNAGDQQGDV